RTARTGSSRHRTDAWRRPARVDGCRTPRGVPPLRGDPPRAPLSLSIRRTLRIENLVLIREAELTFGPGLNAVTGETGAGKKIFAQAIRLLLCARARASAASGDGSEAYVDAELDVPDGFFDEEELAGLA